jgi:hypothetical protein
MKIYQPMLYVGLGGTGCLIGAELERRLREQLCGPDGSALQELMTGQNYLPYQLPSCLQFVYADLNEAELARLHRQVVPTEVDAAAAARTAHLVTDLIPHHSTYPEVARSLRTNVGDLVADWLPPPAGEPRVAPLVRGAGQLPTVGRAALFETFRHGVGAAQRPLAEAIGQISTSGDELSRLGGKLRDACDVFVAFSVAGGTGSGIFYDYLHLIGDAVAGAGYQAQIYPLVVMPSAFDEGLGGGRPAKLNAGRALLDLFRLVDDQNGQAAGTQLDDVGQTGALDVRYPGNRVIRLRPSSVQTAFLFNRPPGVDREDLHRSVVSLMLSLVGTDQDQVAEAKAGQRKFQSFADDFINRGVEREVAAESGIGNRGVSTSLVASMTVPVDDLADIVSARLLAAAVTELSVPPPGTAEVNRPLVERAFAAANIEPMRSRDPLGFTELAPTKGADAIMKALRARVQTMEASLDALDRRLAADLPKLAQDFDPRRAADQLLTEVEPFRLHRVMAGHPQFADQVERIGFLGLLENRRTEPKPPTGITFPPPQAGPVRRRLLSRARWGDDEVQAALRQQDLWFKWRARRAWHAAWSTQTGRWERKAATLRRQLTGVVEAFAEHARTEPARFGQRARDLYRPRIGVSYLLPPQGNDLEPFYQAVLRRFVDVNVARDRLRPTATEAEIVNAVVGGETWRAAFQAGVEDGGEQAVALVRDRLKQEVLRLFRHTEPGEDPLLPTLAALLMAAAGKEGVQVAEDDLAQLRGKIAGLVPGGFSPQGSGPLKILISYPASGKDLSVERFLEGGLNLPRSAASVIDFRPIEAESIAVVLFRTSMAVTEVAELRDVLRHWADAVRSAQPNDFLQWRQRLSHDFGYLATTEEHRVHILHRLLCALWNDQVRFTGGGPESPGQIMVRLGTRNAVSMTLPLTSYDDTSSWGSVLRAYEEWTVADDQQIRRDFCAQLMSTRPDGLESTPRPPGELYRALRAIAGDQERVLAAALPQLPEGSRGYAATLHSFWAETFPAALDLPFTGVGKPVRGCLRDLESAVRRAS